jgi:penicillin amidase
MRPRRAGRSAVTRVLRFAIRAVAVVVLLAVVAVGGLIWATLPSSHDTAHIPGLSAPVTVGWDADGIPRIRAANATDAAAALGWVHARDRLFQMDLMRRAASGRLSEIAGPATLPIDKQARVLGLRARAIVDLAALPPDTRALLDAYASGVNAWIADHGRFSGPEFLFMTALGVGPPEPWTAVDSLLWGKTMAIFLSGNWRTELARLAVAGRMPQARIDQLWPIVESPQADVLNAPPGIAGTALALLAALPRFPDPFTLPDEASNEWAVDGHHTATGAPLLAGDPHLGFSMPGIWYLARIETPDGVMAGATSPGVPYLVIGHNGHIAWTFTTNGADTEDLFIETPAGEGQYLTPDGPKPYTLREERILVRGAEPVALTVRETRHGPVLSDVLPHAGAAAGGPILALASAALAPGDEAAAGLQALDNARDVPAAMAAAARISAPVQNLLIADRTHIGLAVTGRVPIRRAGDGAAPVGGADGAHDWTGFAAGPALPHYLDPPSGRLVNANEPVSPPDFAVFMGRDAFGPWRAQRIRTLLAASDRHTAADFAAMQVDVVSAYAQQILPALMAAHPATDLGRQSAALLAAWDGRMAAELPQPLIFNTWLDAFLEDLIARNKIPPGAPLARMEFLAFVLTPAGAEWCGGNCADILGPALDRAAAALAARWGDMPGRWRWGAAHQAVFAHPIFGRLPVIGPLAQARIDSPGDDGTIDRGGLAPNGDAVHGASFRGVYDLADLDASLFVVAPGQSGNLFRAHARDFVTRWRDGTTVRLAPLAGPPAEEARLLP